MMKTQYIKPEIHMVLLENMLMASNSISWTVDKANTVNDQKVMITVISLVLTLIGGQILIGVIPQIHLTATTGNQKYM